MTNPFAQLQPINDSMLHQPSLLDRTKGGCLNIAPIAPHAEVFRQIFAVCASNAKFNHE